MPRTPVTRINGAFQVQANIATNFKNNGFYAPQLNTAQIAGIPTGTLINGAIVYNTDTTAFQIYKNSAWSNLTISTNPVGYTAIATGNVLPTDGAFPLVAVNNSVGTLYFNTNAPKLWVCSVAGSPGTWLGVNVA